jgi:homoserine O-acetyltransferase/O-succinyltransferase
MARSVGHVETQRAVLYTEDDPLVLESGATLAHAEVAFETYGQLDAARGNTVFVCHALTGDAHVAGHHGDPERLGWWDTLIGPGKPVDTDRFFVVCPNLLGGCKGTTGPSSTDPQTGQPYGLRFPHFTVADLVTVHRRLLAHLGIERVHGAIGGSLGGMQVLQWAMDHPGEVERGVLVCASARLSAQNVALSAVARSSITGDENFVGGDYYGTGATPAVGLAVARMLAHITYVSEQSLDLKFGRSRRSEQPTFEIDFEVESYLDYQGRIFLERFDANTYLYLTRVMDYFDPFADEAAAVAQLARSASDFLVVSFDTDWRFPTAHSAEIARVITLSGRPLVVEEVASPWGHDSFLLEVPRYHELVKSFLGDD